MVSCRPHNFFDTTSYTKPLRFQIYLATNFTQKYFEKICPLGNSTGKFRGQNSKMAKLAEMAVIAGPRVTIFEISKICSKNCINQGGLVGRIGWSLPSIVKTRQTFVFLSENRTTPPSWGACSTKNTAAHSQLHVYMRG